MKTTANPKTAPTLHSAPPPKSDEPRDAVRFQPPKDDSVLSPAPSGYTEPTTQPIPNNLMQEEPDR